MSRTLGRLARIGTPQVVLERAIEAFCRAYHVDLSETEIPEGGFRSFDEFFTRRLRPGARPVSDDPGAVVSPADGMIQDLGRVDEGLRIPIKGNLYDLVGLLGDHRDSREFEGGTFTVIYLSPADYHRVHAPVNGSITGFRHIAGTLFPVNDMGLRTVPDLYVRNERVAFFQRSWLLGMVATVMVGALGVGRITVGFDDTLCTNRGTAGSFYRYGPDERVLRRGDELGVFHLGSTVILLLQGESNMHHLVRANDRIRVGEAIARESEA